MPVFDIYKQYLTIWIYVIEQSLINLKLQAMTKYVCLTYYCAKKGKEFLL